MLKLPKPAAIAIQATLGVALSAPWAVPALAAPPANTARQSQTSPLLHAGDLVRLRSGGPEMTVKSVQGNWVLCTWWSQGWGGFQSAGFPIAMVAGPVTLPSDDAHPQTTGQKSPTEQSPTEPSVHRSGDFRRSGDLNSAGQTNQNSTAQGANQTIGVGQVRPANAGPSMSPGTRPARVLPLQEGTGQTNQNSTVQGTNQSANGTGPARVFQLQQATGQTNQNSTVQGTNQSANANASMSPGTTPARVIQLQQGNGINNQNWPVSPVQRQLSDPATKSPAGAGLRYGP